MLNPENIKQQFEESQSRRRFVKWVGQIAAGASLATLGLGITNPLNALAASKKQAIPDCFQCPCDGCTGIVCMTNTACYPHGNCGRFIVTYKGGCVNPPAQCPTYPNPQPDGCCSPGSC